MEWEELKAVGRRICSEPKVLQRIKQKVDKNVGKNQAQTVKGKISERKWQEDTATEQSYRGDIFQIL